MKRIHVSKRSIVWVLEQARDLIERSSPEASVSLYMAISAVAPEGPGSPAAKAAWAVASSGIHGDLIPCRESFVATPAVLVELVDGALAAL